MIEGQQVLITGGTFNSVAAGGVINIRYGGDGSQLSGKKLLPYLFIRDAMHDSLEHVDAPKCHPDTRVRILEILETFCNDASPTQYRIKWLHGPAGAGKSAIMRTLAYRLCEKGCWVSSFFFRANHSNRNRSDYMFATLVVQLAQHIPELAQQLEEVAEIDRQMLRGGGLESHLQKLIIGPLKRIYGDVGPQDKPWVIIVDGLDENVYHGDIQLLFARLVQDCPTPVRLLVASRPMPSIRYAFDHGTLNSITSRIALDRSFDSDADIEVFLRDEFEDIRTRHPMRAYITKIESWPGEEIIQTIKKRSSGQFIFPSTSMKFIKSLRHNPAKRLKIILGLLPAGKTNPYEPLDRLYRMVLESAMENLDEDEAQDFLYFLGTYLVMATSVDGLPEDTHVSFIEHLHNLDRGSLKMLFCDLESIILVPDDGSQLILFHLSFFDYLCDKSRSGSFHVDLAAIHSRLAVNCMKHLPEDFHPSTYSYILRNIRAHLKEALITEELKESIHNLDSAQLLGLEQTDDRSKPQAYGRVSYLPHLLASSKDSPPDLKLLFKPHLDVYLDHVRATLLWYFERPPRTFLLCIGRSTKDYNGDPGPLRGLLEDILRLTAEEIAYEAQNGFGLCISPPRSALKPLYAFLEDQQPDDPFYLSPDLWTDAALHFGKRMSPGTSEYVYVSDEGECRIIRSAAADAMWKAIPRPDFIEFLEEYTDGPEYEWRIVSIGRRRFSEYNTKNKWNSSGNLLSDPRTKHDR